LRSSILTLISLAIIIGVGAIIAYNILAPEEKLKIFKPSDINSKLVDESLQKKNISHKITSFELLNQNDEVFSEKNLEGKIYVADFFFTTCPTICPSMSAQMKRVHDQFKDDNDFSIISHSVMPEVDTPEVLKAYASRYGADTSKWIFLTGEKKIIYDLARKSYFAATSEGLGDEFDFIHTENFILVDKEKRIRGFYDGTDSKDVDRLIKEIKILKKEYLKKQSI
jgi:protein SCO1